MKFVNPETSFIFVCFLAGKCVFGDNILFYWGASGYSHRISVWPLVEKLAEKGHNVTFFSPYPPKKPNPLVTEISPEHLWQDMVQSLDVDMVKVRSTGGPSVVAGFWLQYSSYGINHCHSVFRSPELVDWINNCSYDLVIINAMINDCAYGIVHKLKVPFIIYGTTSAYGWWSETYGYPEENYPEFQYHYPLEMSYLQSVWNALQPLYWYLARNYYTLPKIEETIKTGLKLNDMPSLSEIEKNVSLVFMNTHYSEEFARSLPPLFVQIGGMHCTDDVKPLVKDLADFLESEEEGFIYFSFGSFAKAGSLPRNIRDAIFGAMKKFKIKFLVKWEGDPPEVLPKNVKAVQWVSQQDVLAHPKIRAFISHGGLIGTQESLYHGVPMILLPLFAEQDFNADRVVARKSGIKLEISELTEKGLENAIGEILNNKMYTDNSKRISRLTKDRPSKPVDTAVWWVEYVLRNKDTSHLRPIGISKNWYQRRMLDIWGFLTIGFLGILISIGLIVYYSKRFFSNRQKKPIRSKKKHN